MTEMRRAPGTGSIEPARGGGFWPRLPGRGARLERCPTYEDAAALLDAACARLASGALVEPGGLALRDHGAAWLDLREVQGIRGVRTERSRWEVHIASASFAALPMTEITRGMIRDWLDGMLAKRAAKGRGHGAAPTRKLGRQTISNALTLLRSCLEAAVEKDLIDENPARGVRLPRSRGVTHEPWTYLLPDEQLRLLSCEAIPIAHRCLVAFALGTGMRQGEVWNLERRDVGADRIVVRYGSRGAATKSGKVRRIPLFGLAAEAVATWLPLLDAQDNPNGLLWPTPRGARRQRGQAPEWWADALTAAGIVTAERHDGRPVHWHDLRHSCASSLVCGFWGPKWSLEEVRQLLGHSSIQVTERYAHLAEGALDIAARAMMGVPRESHGADADAQKTLAPPARLERTTFGLGTLIRIERERDVRPAGGTIVGLALEALDAIRGGGPDAYAVAVRALEAIVQAAEKRAQGAA